MAGNQCRKNNRVAVALFFLTFLVFCQSMAHADEVSVKLPREIVTVSVGEDGLASFAGNELQYLSDPGEPAIPYAVVKLVLPPDASPSSVVATMEKERFEEQPGTWQVRPMPPSAANIHGEEVVSWPSERTIVNGKDTAVYGQEGLFPLNMVTGLVTGRLRKWQIVEVAVAAFQYEPLTGKLFRLKKGKLVVHFSREPALLSDQQTQMLLGDTVADDQVQRMTVNYADMAARYRSTLLAPSAAPSRPGYAIITTKTIADAVGGSSGQLDGFIQSKKQQGHSVYLITEEQWGGGMGNTAADNIRAWLVNNYVKLKLKYVLLIGNPSPDATTGDVPMKLLWPRPCDNDSDANPTPSDYYYAELSGNWDLNGNGKCGEAPQSPCYRAPDLADFGSGGVDRYADVIVGRIPYYGNPHDLNHILQKMIAYQGEGFTEAAWRRKVLLPMVASDRKTLGYQLGEAIKDKILVPQEWGYHRVYEKAYRNVLPRPETIPCNYERVTTAWNSGAFGAVFWWTHGAPDTAVHIMDGNHTPLLDDSRPVITFQCSCLNGYPERSNNLAYSLLKNGAAATVAATRYSWYYRGQVEFKGTTSNSGMTYEFADRLITRKMPAGDALYDLYAEVARSNPQPLSSNFQTAWTNQCVFNLYGDPAGGLFSYLPRVEVVATDPYVSESGKKPGVFTFYRSGQTGQAVTVKYAVSGTAVNGEDYRQLPETVTIPAEASSVHVDVVPIGDAVAEGKETVKVRLIPNGRYEIGGSKEAVVTIREER